MTRLTSNLRDLAITRACELHETTSPPDGSVATATHHLLHNRLRAKALFKELGIYEHLWWKRGRGVGIRKPTPTVVDPVTGAIRKMTLRDRDLLALAGLERWDRMAKAELKLTKASNQRTAWTARKAAKAKRPRLFASKGKRRANLDSFLEVKLSDPRP